MRKETLVTLAGKHCDSFPEMINLKSSKSEIEYKWSVTQDKVMKN